MIREGLVALLLCVSAPVLAGVSDVPAPAPEPEAAAPAEPPQKTATGDTVDETTLQAHRTPFEVLSERMIGTTSRAVRYDWRKATAQLALTGTSLLELNNFNSARFGGAIRVPLSGLLVEAGVAWVWTWGSDASDKLSRTPYRQAGRPNRIELDLMLSYPLFEGVTTPRWGFIPPTELVFMVNAGIRARWYAHELDEMPGDQALGAFFSPRLNDKQVTNLEYARLPGMEIDRGRYDLLAGFSLAVYFQNGVFFSPRVTFAPPLFAAAAGSSMTFWWDLTFSLGWSI